MFLMPSGHNTQPWKFRIADNAIMIEDILFYQIEKTFKECIDVR